MGEETSNSKKRANNLDAIEIEEGSSRSSDTYVGISDLSEKEIKRMWLEDDI